MISGSAIIGFRDANGIKPLVYGKRENMDGSIDYMIASESVVLDNLGFSDIIDIKAGKSSLTASKILMYQQKG
jgi:amidophosphoribosyltransferase